MFESLVRENSVDPPSQRNNRCLLHPPVIGKPRHSTTRRPGPGSFTYMVILMYTVPGGSRNDEKSSNSSSSISGFVRYEVGILQILYYLSLVHSTRRVKGAVYMLDHTLVLRLSTFVFLEDPYELRLFPLAASCFRR